jgi:hypothetical protein
MDIREQHLNTDGKNNFLFKDGKLTKGAKVGAGVLAGGLGLLAATQIGKKKNKEQKVVETQKVVEQTTISDAPIEKETKPNKTLLYVGIGVGAIAIIGLIIYASKN